MKILMLCHNLPNPLSGDCLRPYNLIKYLSKYPGVDIALFSFVDSAKLKIKYSNELNEHCSIINTIEFKQDLSFKMVILRMLKNTIDSLINSSVNASFDPLNFYYDSDVQKEINKIVKNDDFDVICVDAAMASYVSKVKIPKVVEPLDALSEFYKHRFQSEKQKIKKLFWLVQFVKTVYREKYIYSHFNYCTVVTNQDKKILSKRLSNVVLIPNGVDIHFFKPLDIEEEYPSLIYTGSMGTKDVYTIHYFHQKIFPVIFKKMPNIKFYIVGKNPPSSIKELANESIIVTGYVEDMREYLQKSSIFICPMREGTGIKNKVLEAMAMGKPVVSTSIGALGIDVVSGENIIISDDQNEFAEKVIELLLNKELRDKLGTNSIQIIESKYSWDVISNNMYQMLEKTINELDNNS